MVRTLEQAMAQISGLPDADQEKVGRKQLAHVEKVNALRGEIDRGISSLDTGEGGVLDVENFLRENNLRHGGA